MCDRALGRGTRALEGPDGLLTPPPHPPPPFSGEDAALTPRRLTLFNTATRTVIQELPFGDAVGAVRLNRGVAVAVAGGSASVFALESLDRLAVLDVPANAAVRDGRREGGGSGAEGGPDPLLRSSQAAVALTATADPCRLALPAGPAGGWVRVYDFTAGAGARAAPAPGAPPPPPSLELRAHAAPLAAAAWSPDGGLLATASTRGTLIRVWSVPGGARAALRRGATRAAVTGLAFGGGGEGSDRFTLLAASSAHGTVHIFALPPLASTADPPRGPRAWAAAALAGAASASDALAARAAATVRLPAPTVGAALALVPAPAPALSDGDGDDGGGPASTSASTSSTLYVATAEGALYEYNVVEGGSAPTAPAVALPGRGAQARVVATLERELYVGRGAGE